MKRLSFAIVCLALGACGPSLGDDTEGPVLRQARWSIGPPTYRGPMTAVCIPLEDRGACLRLTMVMGNGNEPSHVSGSIVGPECAAQDSAEARVEGFDGTAYTGHGVLWVTGTADLDDRSALDLDLEAELGDCEI